MCYFKMGVSLCLFGLFLFNCALVDSTSVPKLEEIPPLVEEWFEVSGLQHNEDVNKNKTDTEDNENIAIEITTFGSNTRLAKAFIPEILDSDQEINNLYTTESDKDIVKDESDGDEFSNDDFRQITDLKNIKDSDKDKDKTVDYGFSYDDIQEITDLNMTDSVKVMVTNISDDNDGFFYQELTEMFDLNETPEFPENNIENITNTDTDEDENVTLTALKESLMDELYEMEEVERCSRASYLPSSMIENCASIEQKYPFRRGRPVKQRVPVKGRVKIARTFTNCQWNMPPTFTSNAYKGKINDDNIAMKSAPLHGTDEQADANSLTDGNKRVAVLNRNVHGVDKAVLGKVPVSGKFTVAATFC